MATKTKRKRNQRKSSPRCIVIAGPNGAGKTTFARGLSYAARLKAWKSRGYRVEIVYLKIPSPSLALRRIAARVRQGGHDVPKADVLRRFERSWENFEKIYRPLAHVWYVYDNSKREPMLIERSK